MGIKFYPWFLLPRYVKDITAKSPFELVAVPGGYSAENFRSLSWPFLDARRRGLAVDSSRDFSTQRVLKFSILEVVSKQSNSYLEANVKVRNRWLKSVPDLVLQFSFALK